MKKLLLIAVIAMICVVNVLAETNVLEQGSAIAFRINSDRDGMIQNVFTRIIGDAGLKTDNDNSDYLLNVNISTTPFSFPNNPMAYVFLDLTADILDNSGRVILQYDISLRSGHVNQTRAEDRAFRDAVIKINAEYRNLLNDIISR
jgi:hypothetical protein